MLDEEALLDEIRSVPEDDVPRLMLADWLEEQGDPRAELIRVQLELATCGPDDPRRESLVNHESRLIADRRPALIRRLNPLGVRDVRFARGFVDRILLEGSAFLDRPRTLFRYAPVLTGLMLRKLAPAAATDAVTRMLKLPELSGLKSLDLAGCHLSGAAAAAIAESPIAAGLRKLNLASNHLAGEGIQALTKGSLFPELEWLHLGANALGIHDVRTLTRGSFLEPVKELFLPRNRLGDDALRRLAFSESITGLRSLDLSDNDLGPGAILGWSESSLLTHLEEVKLSGNPIGSTGCLRLATSSNTSHLTRLDLSRCDLDPQALENLATSTYLKHLETLDLSGNPIGRGLDWLSRLPVDKLRHLSLAETGSRADQIINLLQCHAWPGLQELDLSRNPVSDSLCHELLKLPVCRQLRVLKLASTRLTARVAGTLAAADELTQLNVLDVSGTELASEAVLKTRFGNSLIG